MCRRHFVEHRDQSLLDGERPITPARTVIRATCTMAGCSKQSQGPANDHMCRAHFTETQKAEAASGAAAAAAAASADGAVTEEDAVAAAVAAVSNRGIPGSSGKKARPICIVDGCDKQSQGRANAYM